MKEVTNQWYRTPRKFRPSTLICVLTGKARTSKQYRIHKDGSFEAPEMDFSRLYTYQIYQIKTIPDMQELLTELRTQIHSHIVYGLPVKEWEPGDERRRNKTNLQNRKTKWLILDFDKVCPPKWSLQSSPTDTFKLLWKELATIPGLPRAIPPSVWHLSSSWGNVENESPKTHAYFLLDNPINVLKLRSWAKYVKKDHELAVDPSIYSSTQPIYTADPRLIGRPSVVAELQAIKRVYSIKKGTQLIASELVLNLPNARDASIPHEKEGDHEIFNYIRDTLRERGDILGERDGFKYDIVCPLTVEHSSTGNETSTTIWAPRKGEGPSFHCRHENTHSDGRNGWNWFVHYLTREGIIKRKDLHKIRQEQAREAFANEPYIGNWTISDIQEKYIYVSQNNEYYNPDTGQFMPVVAFDRLHNSVHESEEARIRGDKATKGSNAFKLSNSRYAGGKVVAAERWDPASSSLITRHGKTEYLNSWRGFQIPAKQGDASAFYHHLEFILPDASEYFAFLDYLAHMIQYPWERPTWSPVHVSPAQGLGRGLLHQIICRIVTPYAATPRMKEVLESQFNDYLYNTLWVGVEETGADKTVSVSSNLKELTTANQVTLNRKYGKQKPNYPLYTRIFFMTNNLDALPIEQGDRRFWVCGPDTPGYEPREAEYYHNLAYITNQQDFQSAVLYELLNHKISDAFNHGAIPFETGLGDEMITASRSAAETAIHYIKTNPQFPPFATSKMIEEWIVKYCDANNQHAPSTEIRKVMKRIPGMGGSTTSQSRMYRLDRARLRFRLLRKSKALRDPTPELVKQIWDDYKKSSGGFKKWDWNSG